MIYIIHKSQLEASFEPLGFTYHSVENSIVKIFYFFLYELEN